MECFYYLWNAHNSLTEVQGRRVDAVIILGKSYRKVARAEGVAPWAEEQSVKRGIKAMKKYLQKNL